MNRRKVAWFLAILAFFIFVGSPFRQTAEALVGVDDAIIAIIIVALAAIGITFTTTGAYETLSDYVGALLQEYCDEHNVTVTRFLNGVQSGTNKQGQILINNRFVLVIDTFAKWIKLKFGLSNGTTITARNQGLFLGLQQLYDQPLSSNYNPVSNDYPGYYTWDDTDCLAVVYFRGDNSYLGFALIKDSPIETDVYLHRRSTSEITYIAHVTSGDYVLANGYYVAKGVSGVTQDGIIIDSNAGSGFDSCGLLYKPSNTSFQGYEYYSYMPSQRDTLNALLYGSRITDQSGIVIDADNMLMPTDDSTYTDGDGAIIDTGSIWGTGYKDVIDGIEDDFSDGKEGSATITYAGEEDVSQQVEDTPTQSVSADASEYRVMGLASVFPFCIPFDIYDFFECLAADPVAPVVNWRFYVPGICDETITLDLSQFDTVAQVVRTMELLAFIVGLALVTREKFLRG